ncbi:MAG TPA: ChaB family protein [Hyphomicrobium sp.]|jgi:cation transport regulator|nr:ChaB family protein [Hyphomicrobium sp.]
MPFRSVDDLPPALRSHLPLHAQEIYRAAFNNAWVRYGAAPSSEREEKAHRIAWAAVKRKYHKVSEGWIER